MRSSLLALVTVVTTLTSATATVAAPSSAAERLASADADIDAALAQAKAQLEGGQPKEAAELLIRLYATEEPFTVESRRASRTAAASLLRDSAEALSEAGDLEHAARASDAAWALDPVTQGAAHAELLVARAKQVRGDAPSEALFLVRRARLAAPQHAEAAALDEAWSTNSLEWVGWGVGAVSAAAVTAGVLSYVAGHELLEQMQAHSPRPASAVEVDVVLLQALSWTSLVGTLGGVLGLYGAGGLWMLGAPDGPPTSPATLPALPNSLNGAEP